MQLLLQLSLPLLPLQLKAIRVWVFYFRNKRKERTISEGAHKRERESYLRIVMMLLRLLLADVDAAATAADDDDASENGINQC